MDKKQKAKSTKSGYKIERKRILAKLAQTEPGSDEYRGLLVMLHSLEESKKTSGERRLSADTVCKSGVSLVSTIALLAFERNNLITSKLLSFIPKIRL